MTSLGKLNPKTIQHSYEITRDRNSPKDDSKRKELRNNWFWTADSSLYMVEDGEAVLYFGRRCTNLIFRNIEKATSQLIDDYNYVPGKGDIQTVLDTVESGNTLKIKLSDLELEGCNNELKYFTIDTKDYDSLNEVQRQFAERVYGQGDDFVSAMKMLKDEGKTTVRIYVLNPDYVKDHVKPGGGIVRASGVSSFENDSDFNCGNRYVGNPNGYIRGESRYAA